ncbi:hypothetical protein [Methylomonas sp. UP202]|uniref:hypothetical protein n=1 Tax=Methylomonas sp. UP202 TaxID=3040943 RepID=UPI00247A473D|nr:hypothetical protein [Methylomonas sp. UP202]WGS85013.1 hypothetical protein QC632_18450 [Methylomonas sp. UP202]
MLELIRRKIEGGSDEDATDPEYLRNAFAVISAHYIAAIDAGDIKFADESERSQFFWLLQLLIDYATARKMADLLPTSAEAESGK